MLSTSSSIVSIGLKTRVQLLKGVKTVSDPVACTFGPRGRNVMIQNNYGPPRITKDGATVAKSFSPGHGLCALGSHLIKNVAQQANDESGDGSTTATIVGAAMFEAGLKALGDGTKGLEVITGLKEAAKHVVDFLKKNSKNISSPDDLYNVARISANGDDIIGKLVAQAVSKVGKDGVVTVAAGKGIDHTLTLTEGYAIDRGYQSPFFVTDSKCSICVMANRPMVCLMEDRVADMQSILTVLEACMLNNRELLIIADDFDPEVLASLIVNRLRGGLKICAVKAPGFGPNRKDILDDVAACTGATVIGQNRGVKRALFEHLGEADSVTVSKDRCLIIGIAKKKAEQIDRIRNQLTRNCNDYEKSQLQERLAKLTGGVAVINVGGISEVEINESRDRVTDAVNATKAAHLDGVLPGGATALFYAGQYVRNIRIENPEIAKGYAAVVESCEAPLRKLAENAEKSVEDVYTALRNNKFGFGYNVLTDEYVDLFKAGILDPTHVVITAFNQAASVATLMCTTESAIYEEKSDIKDKYIPD